MEKTLTQQTKTFNAAAFFGLALLGCAFLVLSSLIQIPFYPVSFTMQTFAISFLALTQSPRLAFASVCCYLLCATTGLPVLCGNANSLWLIGKSGGYLVAFPIAAYLISKLSDKLPKIVALSIGQGVIYLLGMLWLIPFFGLKIAFFSGVVFFIPSDILKNLLALGAASLWKKARA